MAYSVSHHIRHKPIEADLSEGDSFRKSRGVMNKGDSAASIVEQAADILQTARQRLEALSCQTEALYQNYLSEWLEKRQALKTFHQGAPRGLWAETPPFDGGEDQRLGAAAGVNEGLAFEGAKPLSQEAALRQRCAELDESLTRLRRVSYKLDLLLRRNKEDHDYLRERWGERGCHPKAELTPIRIAQSQEEERQRIAHEIQEEVGQLLANAVLELEYHDRMAETELQAARAGLVSLKEELRTGLDAVRWLISELQPPSLLADLGLVSGLKHYTEDYTSRFGIDIKLDLNGLKERLPITMEVLIFRIIQESLQNVRKHAGASRVTIRSQREGNTLLFVVEDNGRGFAPGALTSREARNLGLISMRDRAALLQGRLQVLNKREGGVRVTLSVPYPFDL